MPQALSAEQAAALLRPVDAIGSGLGPAWPPALMLALGQRDDWEDLTVEGALVTVGTELFTRNGVRYKSGFLGPLERYLQGNGARIDFIPADFRRFGPLLEHESPRVMTTAAAPPDQDGWCSLSLHAGGTIPELKAAGADPNRLLIVETSPRFPRTFGLAPEFRHALHVDEIDVLIETESEPTALPVVEPDEVDKQIAVHAKKYILDGTTLQAGIGSLPLAIAEHLAETPGGDYGIHTEMFNDGLMKLHLSGKVTNNKQFHDGKSITTFALGSRELYDWLHENDELAFLPVEQVNDPHLIAHNRQLVTINGALALDIHGQVVADTRDGKQFSGIGGAEDFVSGPAYAEDGHSLVCMPSTATVDGELISRIVPQHPAGAVITTPRHQIDIVVTEFGSVELEGLSVRERGEALASIAHPEFRDQVLAAAVSAG
jgi:acyl-CoA hydrolase